MNQNQKGVIIIGGVIVSTLVILFVLISLNWAWMGGLGAMLFMPVLGIVILGLVVWAFVSAFHKPGESNSANYLDRASHEEDSPIDILKKRYARGEIDREEYEAKKKDLA